MAPLRIAYVARHNSGGNDDEGAITHALRALGHDVHCIPENYGDVFNEARLYAPDLILFHHIDPAVLARLRDIAVPKVFWYFDLVQWPDPTLRRRCLQRIDWFNRIIRNADAGFCTDGDWVRNDPTGKLSWLPQGADERVLGRGDVGHGGEQLDQPRLLFTGIGHGGGVGRVQWLDAVRKRYGDRFTHVVRGSYRRDLANRIAAHTILLCPDAPTTSNYWSNRIYNACGFGAFVLHPWCGELLHSHYRDDREVRYYHKMDHMFALIDEYLRKPKDCNAMGAAALERTMTNHLYRHRCEELLAVCKDKRLL